MTKPLPGGRKERAILAAVKDRLQANNAVLLNAFMDGFRGNRDASLEEIAEAITNNSQMFEMVMSWWGNDLNEAENAIINAEIAATKRTARKEGKP